MDLLEDSCQGRLGLVMDAIDIVLRRLQILHPSPDAAALRAAALRQLRAAQVWERTQPPLEEQEVLMRRVLQLHIGAARLERAAAALAPRSTPETTPR
jgi:hypothetical protein